MPFTALVWNIEEFGIKFARFGDPLNTEGLRVRLLAAVASAAHADVIVVQELRKQGVPYLRRLTAELDFVTQQTWHYDWLPGSQATAVYPPTLFSQLAFDRVGNSEGYAVVWRKDAIAPFDNSKLSAGIDTDDPAASGLDDKRGRYLGLIFAGLPLLFNDPLIDVTLDAGKPYRSLGFPQSICPDRNIVTTTRSSSYESNITIQQQLKTRRPCHVRLKVTNATTVPLVVFHAPVGQENSRSQRFATYMGFASEQLQVADCVYAGDFNVKDQPTQAMMETYTSTRLAPPYKKNTYTTGIPAPSMVRYWDRRSNAFLAGQKVFGSARDYAFARARATSPTLLVRNVLDSDIRAANGGVRGTLTDSAQFISEHVLPDVVRTAGPQAADILDRYMNGQPPSPNCGDDWTAAAVVYRTLISDHLPVVINYA